MHPSVRKADAVRMDHKKLRAAASVFRLLMKRNIHHPVVDVVWRCFQGLWPHPSPAFGTNIARGIPFHEYLGIDRERAIRAFGESSVGIRVVWVSFGSLAFKEHVQGDLLLPACLDGIAIPVFVCNGGTLSQYSQHVAVMVQLAELLRVASVIKRRAPDVDVKWAAAFLRLWDKVNTGHK